VAPDAATAGSGSNGWRRATLALLAGLAVASFCFLLIVVAATPGLDPPPESAALFVVATTAGVIGSVLLRGPGTATAGYLAAVVTGAIVLATLALVVSGTYGPAGPRTNPVGPVAYGLLAAATIVVAVAGWRDAAATGVTGAPSSVR
jgi:hypothetical protein